MTSYRLYSLDGAGKIVGAQWLDAPTDDEAVELAQALNLASRCEVWNRTKFVSFIEASRPTASGGVIIPVL